MEFIEIERFESPWEAYIAAGRLEVEGIPAYILHDNHIGSNLGCL